MNQKFLTFSKFLNGAVNNLKISPHKFKGILHFCKSICLDKKKRSFTLLKVLKPHKLHQTSNFTKMNRYPHIFAASRNYLGDNDKIKILSFGCSTGEEVATLRKYFPSALIIGAEINPYALRFCEKLIKDGRTEFIYSDNKLLKKHGPFDAIFCMAVLQRTPHLIINQEINHIENIYPFKKFEHQINELDQCLKSGGLFIIHYSQYLFADCEVSNHYEQLTDCVQEIDLSPKFNKDGLKLEFSPLQNSIFIKKSMSKL